ncbi:uroporphyrinogen-III C-methyltransferase [Pontibacter diazotrophicus]|uniref:uroporphyrinogen-III C-methyltransferase n=1 Tax=Pontibacter diazotrophicus TaxID=1400979 RepID=A0A3D8LFJ2_9BACT|nr:uroporphyrinogen-III C-methyltransferase [Pontibacter diazotrophicus]RDV16180.1 uroporphyrinogen-III C-methyltransferase [Pontibacter diazotrophicus]
MASRNKQTKQGNSYVLADTATQKQPRLTLVGAGPGDVDLITLKAIKALQQADVVLYDALVNPELLQHAPADAPKLFVGKRAGAHSLKQEEINELIVESAFAYGHVVRLKGGDPFVFGRGYEELAHADKFNIPTQVVPGISSAIAVPELQQIPLTIRGVNESFWVITGTTRSGEISADIHLAAQSSASVIILMGMGKLAQIAEIFSAAGKADTPVAIIQNGSLPDEKIVFSNVHNIVERVEAKGVSAPAIIIIGEVVAYHPSLRYTLDLEKVQELVKA